MARFTDETYLKQWRERQVLISVTASAVQELDELKSLCEADETESIDVLRKMIKGHSENYIKAVQESAREDDNAYKLSYLRNFTAAYYRAFSRRMESTEAFIKEFRHPIWGIGDQILNNEIGYEECKEQGFEARKMDRYMQLLIHIYTNRLLNLGREEQLDVITDEDFINEMVVLHNEFETEKWFDEIAAIRYQLIQCVMTDIAEFWNDEAAGRVFTVDAYDMLNEFNIKPRQEELVGGPRG